MSTKKVSVGPSFLSMLAVAFIVLKLTKVVTWGWGAVLAPIWVPFAILGVVLVILGIVGIIAHIIDGEY